jgi:hypothetical protein
VEHFICAACGAQHAASERPPAACAVCDDERQYVPPRGQSWTTLAALARAHRNAWRRLEPGLLAITTEPSFAIGQRALLVRTRAGNVLWDCLALLDDATVEIVRALGGLAAIAISHPHYYTTMVEWARAFGCQAHVHEKDRRWAMRDDPAVDFWRGDTLALPGGLTAIRAGGHFPGGAVLHWPDGADGRGALLSGDIVQVAPDRRSVSFMHSYPNMIPLDATSVRRVVDRIAPYRFDRMHGAFPDRTIDAGAHEAMTASARRYVERITTPVED